MKKVLLLVVDALATRVVQPALEDGKLPNLKRLVDAGEFRGNCVPIFPSITPAATCGIVTGCYPRDSKVLGAYFYDTEEHHVYYYGDDFWVILAEGPSKFFDDFLYKLNFELLECPTLFEHVERAGLRSACINYLWFRGDVEHKVHVPWLLRLLPGVSSSNRVKGPQILCLGDFVTTRPHPRGEKLSTKGGLFRRFGFDDESTADYLLELVEKGGLPDFTLAYFPDNDYASHDVGPRAAIETLQAFDATLGRLIGQWKSLDAMLQEVVVLITGDHSQTDMIEDAEQASIELATVLDDFEIVDAGEDWDEPDELMVCTNMRAVQIYVRERAWPRVSHLVQKLLADQRVDQVIRRSEWHTDASNSYCVVTRDRGTLRFRLAGPDEKGTLVDDYGGRWAFEGAFEAVDARVDPEGRIQFGDYPNALERIATCFRQDVGGDLWVTARPGYEFRTPRTSVHSGGSHGALHIGDSQVPLIAAGSAAALPERPRTVDVAPLCLALLGITPPRSVGASHMETP